MKISSDLKLVPPSSIPKGLDCPLDDLPELYKLALSMQIICEKENGIGLSAVQVGVPLNFFVVNFHNNYRFFVNCSYDSTNQEKEKYIEGCLSLRTAEGKLRYYEVERFKEIIVKGKELTCEPNLQIKDIEMSFADFYKVVFQHEIDHQNLITIDLIGKEVFLWANKSI
jgi:peptide deformylase